MKKNMALILCLLLTLMLFGCSGANESAAPEQTVETEAVENAETVEAQETEVEEPSIYEEMDGHLHITLRT